MRLPRAIRLTIFCVTVLAIIAGLVFGVRALFKIGSNVGNAQRVMAQAQDKVTPFRDGYIAFDGAKLRCYGPNNKAEAKWDADALEREYAVSSNLVALWRGDSLNILDEAGQGCFTGQLPATISLVQCGAEHVAAYLPDHEIIKVITRDGIQVDDIKTGGYEVLNFGFFSDQDLMWALLLDNNSTQPSTTLRTYQPTRQSITGGYTFEDELIYDVLYNNNRLYIVGTREVNIYNIATGELESPKTMIYGWQLVDRIEISGGDVGLIFALSAEAAIGRPENLLLVRSDGSAKQIHLPNGCIGVFLGSKGVWGVAPDCIYSLSYSGKNSEYPLSQAISEVIAKLSGNRLMVNVNGEMRVLALP